MRVLHVDTERGLRGGQAQLLHLVRQDPGPHVIVGSSGAAWLEHARQQGVDTRTVHFRGRLSGTAALGRVIRAVQPDLVAVHTAHALAHVARLGIAPVVHRRSDFRPSWRARRRLDRARGVIAVSGAIERCLRGWGVGRVPIRVVHDGVPEASARCGANVRGELGLAHEPLVVSVGALVAHKGHRVLVEALRELPGVHAAILGQGPLRADLARRARRAGVSERLHLLGHRSNVGDWLAAASVVCHPSLEEGLGSAVIEAMRAGALVVASRVGGLPEVVEDGGVLVPPDRPAVLASALRGVLQRMQDDPEGWRARASRGAAARMTVQAMIEGTWAAYEDWCATLRSRP